MCLSGGRCLALKRKHLQGSRSMNDDKAGKNSQFGKKWDRKISCIG